MAQKPTVIATLLALSFLFFTYSDACGSCPNPGGVGGGGGGGSGGVGHGGGSGGGNEGIGGGSGGGIIGGGRGTRGGGSRGSGGSSGRGGGQCPIDTLKLGVCANVLNGLVNLQLGTPPRQPCCSLIQGLADLEVAVCLCTALRANVLGININAPIDLSLLINYCGRRVPSGFQCPN